jgi:hypothetical protein
LTLRAPTTDAPSELFVPLSIGAAFAVLYLCTAPDVVNLDGLGYLKLVPHNFAAGHLLFMPLFRAAIQVTGRDGLHAGRLLDALLGATGLVLTYGIARRMGAIGDRGRAAPTVAAIGLGLSYGYWLEGADLESYAAAMVALLGTVRLALSYAARPAAPRAAAVGVALACAVLCHLEHVVLAVFVAVHLTRHAPSRSRGLGHAALALGLGGAISLGAYAYAALVVRRLDLPGAIRWVLTAGHGFYYGGGAYRLADGVYGFAKALVYAPYLYEADAPRLIGQFLLGFLPLAGLALRLRSDRAAWEGLDRPSLLAWVLPYAGLAICFFGSDCERWIFVLPAVWLLGARVIAGSPRRAQWSAATLLYVGVLNFAIGVWPAHTDDRVRRRAEAAAHAIGDGDLVIFPGHSWDEYVTLYAAGKAEPFPFVYYAARDGLAACLARLEREVAATVARRGRIYAVRVFDEDQEDPRGFTELRQLGIDRTQLQRLIADRFSPAPPTTPGAPVRLDPHPAP